METSIGWTATVVPEGTKCPTCNGIGAIIKKEQEPKPCTACNETGTVYELPGFTFNPWIGCHKVSPGCKNCYAEADMDKRRGRVKWGIHGTRSVTSYAYWRNALHWNAEAKRTGVRRKVFCASLADWAEDWKGQVVDSKGVPLWWPPEDEWYLARCEDIDGLPTFAHQTVQKEGWQPLTLDIIRMYLYKLIEKTPYLDWLLLTKRPENIEKFLPERWDAYNNGRAPRNIWFGCSITNNDEVLRVWPVFQHFAKGTFCPYRIFLSIEPLLGPLRNFEICLDESEGDRGADWIIVGFESGHNARAGHPDWVRAIRDLCLEKEVPFFFKQWGEYSTTWVVLDSNQPAFKMYTSYQQFTQKQWVKPGDYCVDAEGKHCQTGKDFMEAKYPVAIMNRTGKKAGSNRLDGAVYQQFPESVKNIFEV